MSQPVTSPGSATPPPSAPPPAFSLRLALGLLGVLLAAMLAGLSDRLPGLALVDISGALGFSHDGASWLNTAYLAGELSVMPFATWMAITFSLRRFHLWMLSTTLVLATVLPFIHALPVMIALRAVQGFTSGALIPLLMMSALRFLPLSIRLHGLALYAMTATFAPNIALWLASLAVDGFSDWHWIYWIMLPPGIVAMVLVAWGIPVMPPVLSRMKQGNWFGMAFGIPGLSLLVVGLDQGVRLNWFNSPIICAAFLCAAVLCTIFLISEWFHPAPFIRLQLLERRNLWLGFILFICLLVVMSTAVGLPATLLENIQGFRLPQVASMGLMVGLPQIIIGPLIALLLYRPWVDARKTFILGLICIALSCWLNTRVTDQWMTAQFTLSVLLQTLGQPLAIISLLFLATSVIQPMEGPYVSGIINTLRAAGTVFGSALIGQISYLRGSFHSEMLLNNLGSRWAGNSASVSSGEVAQWVSQQSALLSTADVYYIFTFVTLLLIPGVMCLKYIPAPRLPATPPPAAPAPAAPSTTASNG